jgi:two-component system chemotaxis response regulator CheY
VMAEARTVMVIDDASLVRLYYRAALEAAGFRVEEALNGLEALEKLPRLAVDLLVVDVNMPQLDGFSFLKKLRRMDGPIAAVPAMITSTEAGEADFAAARAAGANFYLVKPVDAARLVEHAALLCGVAR